MEPTLQAIADATGKTLLAPTLADILGRHGLEYIAIGTGTSGNAYQHNPNAGSVGGATIHPDFTLPRSLHTLSLKPDSEPGRRRSCPTHPD